MNPRMSPEKGLLGIIMDYKWTRLTMSPTNNEPDVNPEKKLLEIIKNYKWTRLMMSPTNNEPDDEAWEGIATKY